MLYHCYRSADTTASRRSTNTTRLHRTLENLQFTMKEYMFSGEDQILISEILSRLREEAHKLEMNGEQLVACLLHMLKKTSAREYRSSSRENRTDGLA